MEIFSPLAVFKQVDFPAEGRPTIATTAVLGPMDGSIDGISSCCWILFASFTGAVYHREMKWERGGAGGGPCRFVFLHFFRYMEYESGAF